MNILKVDNTAFGAGKVKLKGLDSKDLSVQYDKLRKIANNGCIDLLVLKNQETKALPKNDMYSVIAYQDVAVEPYVIHGFDYSIIHKDAAPIDVGARVLETAINAVKNLNKRVEKIVGIDPGYLSWMK